MSKVVKFNLAKKYMDSGQEVAVGGHNKKDPKYVRLHVDGQTSVEGEGYRPWQKCGFLTEDVRAVFQDLSGPEKLKVLQSLNQENAKTTVDKLLEVEPADAPLVPEGVELNLSDEAALRVLPPKETILEMNRSELEGKAKSLGLWDLVQGTGKNGYRQVEDIQSFFFELIEADEAEMLDELIDDLRVLHDADQEESDQ